MSAPSVTRGDTGSWMLAPALVAALVVAGPALSADGAGVTELGVVELEPTSAVIVWRAAGGPLCTVLVGQTTAPDPGQPASQARMFLAEQRPGDGRYRLKVSGLEPDSRCTALVATAGGQASARIEFTTPAPLFRNVAVEGGPASGLRALADTEFDGDGLAWGDLDGDGDPDLVLGGRELRTARNDGDMAFSDSSKSDGLEGSARQVLLLDADLDGRLDVFVTRGGEMALYLNETAFGKIRFTDRSDLLGRWEELNNEGAGVLDFDRDGLPDLLVTNEDENILLRNAGPGQPFEDWSIDAGLGREGLGLGNGDYLTMADFTGDGRLDFFYHLDRGVLAVADGTAFRLVERSGIDVPCQGGGGPKMGTDAGDVDGDGDADLVVPLNDEESVALLLSQGNGVFEKAVTHRLADLSPTTCRLLDLDADGDLDIYAGCEDGQDTVLWGDGTGRFTLADPGMLPEMEGAARGIAAADADGDGDLDLAVLRDGGGIALLATGATDKRPGSACRLRWGVANLTPCGGRLELVDAAGNVVASAVVCAGTGWGSQDDLAVLVRADEGDYTARFTAQDGSVRTVPCDIAADVVAEALIGPESEIVRQAADPLRRHPPAAAPPAGGVVPDAAGDGHVF